MTSVTIPNSVTSIGESAFYKCSSLTSVHISDVAAWCKISFGGSNSNPLYYAHHLYIGENEITDLVIPNSVTSIGSFAFYSCSGLTSVTIPNSVTSIGNWAFAGCSSLTSVTIPNSVTSIGGSAFSGCSRLTSVTIPNSVTSIGVSAFEGCSGLTSVTIPNSVTSIGDYAFHYCSGLTSVTIPNSVTTIGKSAFYGCRRLTSVTIGNSVTSIGGAAFWGCSGLTSVTIPNSVTSIGSSAFYGCSGLTSVTIPNSVTSIGGYAFYGCSGLTSVTIPNSVTSIGSEAFRGCSGLTSVTIGSGVKNIDSYAFASCKDLTDVYCLAEKVPSTNTDAFKDSYIEYATLHVPAASIDDYKAVEPWKDFKSIVSLNGEDMPEVKKCATPTIALVDGKLVFSCETEGVEYVSEVKVGDAKKNYTSTVSLTGVYTVSVYAMKTGWENSDVATMEFTLGAGGEVCDTNKDGTVDVADIATIITKMAGH
ncbi:MAG: leucine-rich repeat domain-containing protein [Prevotella sp.]|nr:leucine-rich repeat domain-containing protein [Prevotella sp.]